MLTFTGSPPVGWELKSVGTGREGLRYAIEEMTELKLLTFNHRTRPA